MRQKKGVRKNGFSQIFGPNYYQICSWIYFIIDSGACLYLIYAIPRIQYGLLIWEIVLVIIMSISCIMAAYIDTTDKIIYQEKLAAQKKQKFTPLSNNYCLVCQGHVQTKTKHCGSCNRCTSRFDHHCVWLNNCIGEYNYKYFFILVMALVLHKSTKVTVDIMHINYDIAVEYFVVSITFVIFDILLLLVLTYLLIMHCYFRYRRITTYEWIKIKRSLTQSQLSQKDPKENKDNQPKNQDPKQEQPMFDNKNLEQYGTIGSNTKRFTNLSSRNQENAQMKGDNFRFSDLEVAEDEKSIHAQPPPQQPQIQMNISKMNYDQIIPKILNLTEKEVDVNEDSIIDINDPRTQKKIQMETLHNLNNIKKEIEKDSDQNSVCTHTQHAK